MWQFWNDNSQIFLGSLAFLTYQNSWKISLYVTTNLAWISLDWKRFEIYTKKTSHIVFFYGCFLDKIFRIFDQHAAFGTVRTYNFDNIWHATRRFRLMPGAGCPGHWSSGQLIHQSWLVSLAKINWKKPSKLGEIMEKLELSFYKLHFSIFGRKKRR